MKVSDVIVAVLGTVLKVCIAVVVVMVVYKGAMVGYDYGYRVFAEEPLAVDEGRTVPFVVTEEMAPVIEEDEEYSFGTLKDAFDAGKEIGSLLEEKGLIRDRNLFVVQFLLSEYRVNIKPGEYELSTAMTVDEMLSAMTVGTVRDEGEETE